MNRPAFTLALALCFLGFSLEATAQRRTGIAELRDQSQITLRGKLRIEQRGWRTCFFLETSAQYRVMFDPSEEKPRITDLIEVILPGQTRTLRRSIGRNLTAKGKVQLEPGSPYYCNGAAILADEIALPSGTKLHKISAPALPRSVTRYSARVTLLPGAEWKFTARNPSGKSLGSSNLAGCSLNGAADVLNCSCIEGFQPLKGKTTNPSKPGDEGQENLLQFDLDQDARQQVTINVECVRSKPRD